MYPQTFNRQHCRLTICIELVELTNSETAATTPQGGGAIVGGFLFSKISETPIVHVPKLFPLLHWFQNTFCFLCSSTPSHGDSIFWLKWEFQWENDQNK